jgi:hypothetical protein
MTKLLCLAFISACPSMVLGCSCAIFERHACSEVWQHDAVFLGTVESISPLPPNPAPKPEDMISRVRFKDIRSFRGIDPQSASIDIDTGGGAGCDYRFTQGGSYIVYARRSPKTGRLVTTRCGFTHPLESAKEDLDYLATLQSRPVNGWILGSFWVMHGRGIDISRDAELGTRVIAKGADGGSRETILSSSTHFEIDDLPPGPYTVTAFGTSYTSLRELKVVVPPRGCAVGEVMLGPAKR